MYLCSMEMQLFKNITPQNMPERMNNPFSYEPHPLCIEACRELQDELSQRNDWREEIDRGKMFGVLIVEAGNGKIGYLRAYSGQIGKVLCQPFSIIFNPTDISRYMRLRFRK